MRMFEAHGDKLRRLQNAVIHDALNPPLTERQADQAFIERQRADYLARANAVSTPNEPIDPEWDGVKL